MSIEDDLCLSEVRLKDAERWSNNGLGLWFVFPRAGVGEFVTGAVRQRLSCKEALMANAGSVVTIFPAERTEFVFRCFRVALETLFPLLTCEEIPQLRAVADTLKAGKNYPAEGSPVARCASLLENVPPGVNLEHRTLLLRVVAILLSAEFQAVNGVPIPAASASQRVLHVLKHLSAADIANSSVDELARKFSCSRRHLNRLFHAQFGLSAGALRMEARLLKATALLRDPETKIINVAVEAGFNHLGLFNTCFKRRFGLSPSQWRKAALTSRLPSPASPVPIALLANQQVASVDGCRIFH